jgi:hypothetical protein
MALQSAGDGLLTGMTTTSRLSPDATSYFVSSNDTVGAGVGFGFADIFGECGFSGS